MRAMTIPPASSRRGGGERGGKEAHMDRFNANSADCAFTIREFITICGFVSRLSSTFYFFRYLFFFLFLFLFFFPPSSSPAPLLLSAFQRTKRYFNLRIQTWTQMPIVYDKFPTDKSRASMFFSFFFSSLSLSLALSNSFFILMKRSIFNRCVV